ncbi:hypothetical protein [Pararhodospirillum photometricum]|uniref:hypothetical protein n=1 Tax=Pararhodospirillum photometricum TaxID=1084 RepID=UPI0018D2A440|nr:hypothetical protein [Pararhodospirillum photometricum]
MFRVVAAQQARATGPNRHAARQSVVGGLGQGRVVGQGEVIVGREVEALGRQQGPAPAPARQLVEIGLVAGEAGGRVGHR